MPKPTKYATIICLVLSAIALIGMILGFVYHHALIVVSALLPIVVYEIYRTEGKSTKLFSWAMLFVLVAELVLLIWNVNYNLANFLGQDSIYVGHMYVQLGDIKTIGPVLLAAISVILLIRTYGIYTKWLSIVIIVGSFATVYILNPILFSELTKSAIRQMLGYL